MVPTVSVLTTTYNKENFILSCIECVINSKYNNWELIIVDDDSTDRSLEIAQNYAQKDNRIKVFHNEKNLGDYPNRNKAASFAKGKYLKYLDADDLLYPYSLEIMVSAMEKFPEAALGISEYVKEDMAPYPFMLTPHETYIREFLKHGILGVGPTATIIRREAFEHVGGFSSKRYVGDSEFWLKLSGEYPIVKIQSGLIFWRQHEDQEIKKELNDYQVLAIRYNLELSFLKPPYCPLLKDEIDLAVQKIIYRHGRKILHIAIKKRKIKKAVQVFNESGFTIMNLIKSLIPKTI